VLSIPHESKQEEKIFSDTKHSIQWMSRNVSKNNFKCNIISMEHYARNA
jgi:hypothetical protein